MDKKIFSAAFIVLIFELAWLLADMEVIYIKGITQDSNRQVRQQIGTVEERRHTLKRRFLDSIVWEETNAKDPLYYMDSVLTLDQSSAILKLGGDTQLSLSENTLVVLEPSTNDKVDQLRVRFSRGDVRSRNPDRNLAVDASTWTVEVEKGSEVSLRTKDSENLELEVHKGKVKVKEESQVAVTEFETGDVIKMHNAEMEHQKIDESFLWKTPIENLNLIRKYSHTFPVNVKVEWQGHAESLSWEDPNGKSTKIKLAPNEQTYGLFLEKGLHHLRLNNASTTSPVLPVEVWKAPEIYTLWPLPRDRYMVGKDIPFSWSNIEDVTSYQINVTSDNVAAFSKRVENRNTSSENIQLEGAFEWNVEATDTLGFQIPYYYQSPIYFIKNPLAPPILETPEMLEQPMPVREPAKDPKSSWIQLLQFFLPEAQAKTPNYRALFKWQKVEGAEQYIIEIDDEPNFKTPLLQETVKKSEYVWEGFKLNTYYWRVAAEGKKGEMGLFSPVTPVDLTNPKVFTPSIPEEPPPKIAKKTPPKKLLVAPPKEIEKPVEKVLVETDNEVSEHEIPNLPEGIGRPIRGYVLWTPTYEMSQGSGAQNMTTSFTGFHLVALDTKLDFPIDSRDTDLTVKLFYDQGDFKPLPEADFPFQEKISRSRLRGSVYYGESREWKLGMRSSTFQIIKRKGFEQVGAEEAIAFGPCVNWPITEDWETDLGILVGSQSYIGEWQLRYNLNWLLGGSLNIKYGGEFEIRYIKSDAYQEQEFFPKIFLGLSW